MMMNLLAKLWFRNIFKFAKRSVADTLWGGTKPGEGSSSTDSYTQ